MNRKTLLAAACLVLFASPAFAASHLYISEYVALPVQDGTGVNNPQVAQETSLDQGVVDYTSGAATSAAFGTRTRFVRLLCTSTCSVLFSTAGTAATSANKPLAAGSPEYFGVLPGMKVSVISNTDF